MQILRSSFCWCQYLRGFSCSGIICCFGFLSWRVTLRPSEASSNYSFSAESLPYSSTETQARYKLGRQLSRLRSSWFKPKLQIQNLLCTSCCQTSKVGFVWGVLLTRGYFLIGDVCLAVFVMVICLLRFFCLFSFPGWNKTWFYLTVVLLFWSELFTLGEIYMLSFIITERDGPWFVVHKASKRTSENSAGMYFSRNREPVTPDNLEFVIGTIIVYITTEEKASIYSWMRG